MGFHHVAVLAGGVAAAHRFQTRACGSCSSASTIDPNGNLPAADVVPA